MNDDANDFDKLIHEYLALWPNKIDVSQERIEGKPSPYNDLISAHDAVEEVLYSLNDNKLWVLDWCVFKHLSSLAKRVETIDICELDLNLIKATYIKDIHKWRNDFG